MGSLQIIALVLGFGGITGICFGDFQRRKIPVWSLLLLAVGGIAWMYGTFPDAREPMLERIGMNAGLAIGLIIWGELVYRLGLKRPMLGNSLGVGDLILLLSLSPWLTFPQFLLILWAGIALVLLSLQIRKLMGRPALTSPLPIGGILSLWALFCFSIFQLFPQIARLLASV